MSKEQDAAPTVVRAGDSEGTKGPIVKPPIRIHMRWIEDERFDAGRAGGPRSIIDGHSVASPGPMETMVSALGACSAVDVLSILNKRRTPAREFSVNLVAQRAQSIPARLVSAELTFTIAGDGIDQAACERAIVLSLSKYCSVRGSLNPDIPIYWILELNGTRSNGTIEAEAPPA